MWLVDRTEYANSTEHGTSDGEEDEVMMSRGSIVHNNDPLAWSLS